MLARFVCPASRLPELEAQLGARERARAQRRARRRRLGAPPRSRRGGRDGRRAGRSSRPPASSCSARSRSTPAGATRSPPSPRRARKAKLRCGGSPSRRVEEVAAFFAAARDPTLPFKATAGLHHPVRTEREHGFLNLLTAADRAAAGAGEAELRDDSRRPRRGRRCATGSAAGRALLRLDRLVLVRRARRGSAGAGAPVTRPLGVFSPPGGAPRVGARDGERVLDLAAVGPAVLADPSLNPLMAAGPQVWAEVAAHRRRARLRARRRRAAPAVRGRRLRRLLLVDRACDEPRPPLPARRRAAAAELAPPAGRLPRPRRHRRAERDADPCAPAARPSRRTPTRRASGPAAGSTSSSSSAS